MICRPNLFSFGCTTDDLELRSASHRFWLKCAARPVTLVDRVLPKYFDCVVRVGGEHDINLSLDRLRLDR